MNFIRFIATILIFYNARCAALPANPSADEPDPNLTIDEIIRNAGLRAEMNSVINIARNPSNIDNYVDEHLIRQGSVLWDLDMLFTKEQWEQLNNDASSTRKKRKAIRYEQYRWKDNVVPYEINPRDFSDYNVKAIKKAMTEWSKQVCLTFRRALPSDSNRIVFQDGRGCSSYVGSIGGKQPISLASGCRYHGVITHEIGHAIGFQHEQTRPDRNKYVTIHEENIIPSTLGNFRLFNTRQVNNYDVPYDYLSVMHYGARAFSRNGHNTISTKDPAYTHRIGNRVGLSFLDIKAANLMYKCAERSKCGDIECPAGGFVDKDCQCKCDSGNRYDPATVCKPLKTPAPTQSTSKASSQSTTTTKPTTQKPSTTTTTPSSCIDEYAKYCRSWARNNGCNRYKSLMERGCKKTCGLCEDSTKVTQGPCKDLNEHYCPGWATRGYCSQSMYKMYMLTHCRKSCGMCASTFALTGVKRTCVDKWLFCPLWSGLRQCKSTMGGNWQWILRNCKKSCGACSSD